MVLLQGLNYDYSNQQKSILTTAPVLGATKLVVKNTAGLADDDYLVIAPGTEKSEIVKIGAAVSSDVQLTISALKFSHYVNDEIYRLNYNQMKFYESSDNDTFTVIANSTVEMDYSTNNTTYDYTSSTADYYYKRIFVNENSVATSDIALSISWQPDDEELYVTPGELRTFLQFEENDFPNPTDMRFFIKVAMKKVTLDIDSSNTNILFIATLLLSKYFTVRGLATKSVGKGYIQVMAEGRTITKSYQEFVLEAENVYQEYKEFILSTTRTESTRTNFLDDTTQIDAWTRSDIIGIMNGTSDGIDVQQDYRFSYFWRTRRS